MLESTKQRFCNKLREDINRLCSLDDKLYLRENKLELVFDLYERYRTVIHDYIGQHLEDNGKVIRMDRHKVATAFFCAILKARPVEIKPDAVKFFEKTVNEQLALIFSVLYIIDKFNISEIHKDKIDKEIYDLPIVFPECPHSHVKDYKVNFIMLFISETQRLMLDIDSDKFEASTLFIISHLFFLLDVYSYQENRQRVMGFLSEQ